MNITETISLLDEQFAKAKEYNELFTKIAGSEDSTWDALIFKSYPALRQAALDGERYRKEAEAGETLAKEIEAFKVIPIVCGSKEAQYSMNFLLAQIERQLKRFSTTYRQAVEQKEV